MAERRTLPVVLGFWISIGVRKPMLQKIRVPSMSSYPFIDRFARSTQAIGSKRAMLVMGTPIKHLFLSG
jgi:anthranilate phosphoribosyltransferase